MPPMIPRKISVQSDASVSIRAEVTPTGYACASPDAYGIKKKTRINADASDGIRIYSPQPIKIVTKQAHQAAWKGEFIRPKQRKYYPPLTKANKFTFPCCLIKKTPPINKLKYEKINNYPTCFSSGL